MNHKHLLLFVIILTALALYKSPVVASNFKTTDSIEYAFAAENWATSGVYGIDIGGRIVPPRFLPWFSIIFISPFYAVLGSEIGNAVIPIILLGIGLCGLLYSIASKAAGPVAGLITILFLMLDPTFETLSREIQPTIGLSALILWCFVIFGRLMKEPEPILTWLIAGTLIAIATAINLHMLLLLLPFLAIWDTRRTIKSFLSLIIPVLIPLVATLGFNHATFGSPLRSGYQFWMSIPYDYPELIFSLGNIGRSLAGLLEDPSFLVWILGILFCILWIKRKNLSLVDPNFSEFFTNLRIFGIGFILPYTALLLASFDGFATHAIIFHILLIMIFGVLFGGIASCSNPLVLRSIKFCICIFLAAMAINYRFDDSNASSGIRARATEIYQHTEPDAIVITALPITYLYGLKEEGSKRKFIPISRSDEYASKIFVTGRVPILIPPARGPFDHRPHALVLRSGIEVVPRVATEIFSDLSKRVKEGAAIYFESTDAEQGEIEQMTSKFKLEPITPTLSRIRYLE